ncbi:hypothetical protein Scep_020013 [Stephania cephalantha]|uniref:Uncharacterized protein n=1 Tax=Stephania cephalantha TaxID=152367 RepID=A0AAP0NNJ6_9MAGN
MCVRISWKSLRKASIGLIREEIGREDPLSISTSSLPLAPPTEASSFIKIIHITTKFGEINLTPPSRRRDFALNRASDRSTTRHRAVGAAALPAAPPLLRRRCCWSTPHPRLIRSSASRHTAAAAGAAAARSGADRPHQPSLRAATWSSGAGTAVRTGRHLSCAAGSPLRHLPRPPRGPPPRSRRSAGADVPQLPFSSPLPLERRRAAKLRFTVAQLLGRHCCPRCRALATARRALPCAAGRLRELRRCRRGARRWPLPPPFYADHQLIQISSCLSGTADKDSWGVQSSMA